MQENFKRAIESKLHYKDEWAKAFREYHKLYQARAFDAREENVDKKFERYIDYQKLLHLYINQFFIIEFVTSCQTMSAF